MNTFSALSRTTETQSPQLGTLWCPRGAIETNMKGGKQMPKSTGSRGASKSGSRGKGPGGRPSTTGNKSGGGRDNAPPKGKK